VEEVNKDENLSPKVKASKTFAMVESKLSTHHFKHLPFIFFLSPFNENLLCQQFFMVFFQQ
jgi:hypothetical protein